MKVEDDTKPKSVPFEEVSTGMSFLWEGVAFIKAESFVTPDGRNVTASGANKVDKFGVRLTDGSVRAFDRACLVTPRESTVHLK